MKSKQLIESYYQAFNQGDVYFFLPFVSEKVVHEANQGKKEVGIPLFKIFMERMHRCYQEKISQVVVMVNEEGSRAACEYVVEGTYLKTDGDESDPQTPQAFGQTYRLPGGAFFDIDTTLNKITRITNYYNYQDWYQQVVSKR